MSMLSMSLFVILCPVFVLLPNALNEPLSNPIEAGRHALESRRQLPWYDADEDTLRRINVAPYEDDPKRMSKWAITPGPRTSRTRNWKFPGTLLRVLAWIALGLLLTALVWALVWAIRSHVPGGGVGSGHVAQEVEVTRARIEDLPVPVSPHHTDLLAAARSFFEAGDLGKAIIYAFAHQLVELDRHHLIRLTRGKTNREYLRELRTHPRFVDLLKPTMFAFEDVFFGHHEVTRQRFEACWADLDRFHRQLEQVKS